MKRYFLTTILMLAVLLSSAQSNRQIAIEELDFFTELDSDHQFYAVVFLGTDCPISQKYGNTLRELFDKYADSVTFVGLFPKNFTISQITEYQQDYRIPFKLFRDEENIYAEIFEATVTPEVFLFDDKGTIFYDGAIDNWFYSLGRNRMKPTEMYLENAITLIRDGKVVEVSHVDAVGCFIQRKKK